ncbi:MAG TPA: type VI secretion system-associated protein TagF [Ignavibacteriaceae bacterium]|nr:type VI secretion system-associated protein TagF [Ignavibacteriaceae bacterium]
MIDYKFSAGYFGKLPNFPDFIKYNAAMPEILILDKWIQDGILWGRKTGKNYFRNTQAGRGNAFDISSPLYFLFPFTRTENILLGIIYPSSDKTGREFPFIIFMSLSKNKTSGLPAYLFPLFFSEWFDFCNLFFTEISSLVSSGKESLLSLNLKLNHPPVLPFIGEKNLLQSTKISYNNFISENIQQEFCEKVLEDSNGLKFSNLLNNLVSSLSFLRLKPDSSVSFGIKITMIHNPDYVFFYIGFFIQTVMIISRKDSNPGIFIKNEKSFTHLFIFFNCPVPQHYTDLFYDNGESERMINANALRNSEKINTWINFFSGNPKGNLKDILNELT